jgi:Fe-S oxidoreductase
MKRIFAPGCALMLYKPELADKMLKVLTGNLGAMDTLDICCLHDPHLPEKMEVINVCPGCDKRFKKDYESTATISLWEILAQSDFFRFPDYHGKEMTILDACPTREKEEVHEAIRILLKKMNIKLIEPEKTRTHGTCCGDSFYGTLPTPRVIELMEKRAGEMPVDDVIVYCISCVKSIFIGGKKPHFLVDLLMGEETEPQVLDPDVWHQQLDEYIAKH